MAGWTPQTLIPSRTGFAAAPQGASNMAGSQSSGGMGAGVGTPEPLGGIGSQTNQMRSSMPAQIPNPGAPGSNEIGTPLGQSAQSSMQSAQGGLDAAIQSASNPNNSFGYGR